MPDQMRYPGKRDIGYFDRIYVIFTRQHLSYMVFSTAAEPALLRQDIILLFDGTELCPDVYNDSDNLAVLCGYEDGL